MHSLPRSSELLQQPGAWRFDIRSALIGAIIAWIMAAVLFSQRRAIKQLAASLWAPVAAWRQRARASQTEKYIRTLREQLKRLLLFRPRDPEVVYLPPTFLAPAPLPSTVAEAAQSPRIVTVSYDSLLEGHNKLVLTGYQGSGRTATLLMTAWQSSPQDMADGEGPLHRFPVWIDLEALSRVDATRDASAAEHLVDLAAAFMPDVLPKWLLQRLHRDPCLLLLDNWDQLAPDQRALVTRWVREAAPAFPDAFWMVASSPEGYGDLVEVGFVPVEMLPSTTPSNATRVFEGWQSLVDDGSVPLDEEVEEALASSIDAGGPPWELHLRTRLYLRTQELPERPVAVIESYVRESFAAVEFGKNQEPLREDAEDATRQALTTLGALERFEGRPAQGSEWRKIIQDALPAEHDQRRRLEGAVQRLLSESHLLDETAHRWQFAHAVWRDYFAAAHLAQEEQGQEVAQAHLNDPTWSILLELFAGLSNVEEMAQALLNQASAYRDYGSLLRAARWAVVADPEQPWRKVVAKALAQTFLVPDLEDNVRLSIGHALGLVAGDGARAFFLRTLRRASTTVQAAALRGLGWLQSPQDMSILAAVLRDSEPDLQASAIRALRDLGTPGAFAYLRERLSTLDERLMVTATEALASSPDGWPALEEALGHPDLLVRRAAALALGQLGKDWSRELLLEVAREDPEWLVRSAADAALQAQEEAAAQHTKVSPPPDVAEMDWLIAWAARQGTGVGVGEAATEALIRAAQEGNPDAKALSALTLAQIGREDSIRILEPLLDSRDHHVLQAADWAIRRIRERYRIYRGE